jgi:hypothetical protein
MTSLAERSPIWIPTKRLTPSLALVRHRRPGVPPRSLVGPDNYRPAARCRPSPRQQPLPPTARAGGSHGPGPHPTGHATAPAAHGPSHGHGGSSAPRHVPHAAARTGQLVMYFLPKVPPHQTRPLMHADADLFVPGDTELSVFSWFHVAGIAASLNFASFAPFSPS